MKKILSLLAPRPTLSFDANPKKLEIENRFGKGALKFANTDGGVKSITAQLQVSDSHAIWATSGNGSKTKALVRLHDFLKENDLFAPGAEVKPHMISSGGRVKIMDLTKKIPPPSAETLAANAARRAALATDHPVGMSFGPQPRPRGGGGGGG